MDVLIRQERLTADAYIDFLRRSDLGSQYPAERFAQRIARLVDSVPVSLTARDEAGRLVGVLFALTDWAYWMFITDLGVDREHMHRGIGRQLVHHAHALCGGEHDIVMYTCANEDAVPFYEKLGMTRSTDVMEYNKIDWTAFRVE